MYFDQFGRHRLRAVLTQEDLAQYHLTCDHLGRQDQQVRAVLFDILERACLATGFPISGGRLCVEIYPLDEGCVIDFSPLEEAQPEDGASGQIRAGVMCPEVFAFADCERMISACTKGFRHYGHRIFKSALYYLGGCFQLVIYPLDGQEALGSMSAAFFCEYGRSMGRGEILAAYVAEHGKPIAEENAIDKISYYLS